LADIADETGLTPAGVVLAWNATRGVVSIPSSTTASHIVGNLAAAGRRLDAETCNRIEALRRPDFER
jgi:alcohol dehydrogenase (NADP+)